MNLVSTTNIRKSIYYIKNFGFNAFIIKVRNKVVSKLSGERQYQIWIKKNEPKEIDLEAQRRMSFAYEPKISIVTPVFNTPQKILIEMIESVITQTYAKWELCIADGNSKEQQIKEILKGYAEKDNKIKIKFLQKNKGIAGNSNEALSASTGDFVTFLDHDDKLSPFALYEIVNAINKNADADFFYSDEDILSFNGKKRLKPHFKPDWSPDTLRSYNYITHLTVIRRDLLEKIGLFREGFDGSQDYDLILRAAEHAKKIIHISKVLYHWRESKGSAAGNPFAKLYAYDAAEKVLSEHLLRICLKGEVHISPLWGTYMINYMIEGNPKISIIIPNNNHAETLKKCISSILDKSTYKNYEIIIVENNSDEKEIFSYYKEMSRLNNIKIAAWNNPFNYSAVNNYGVTHSDGDILLFLNNDTEVINNDWLQRMLEHAQRKEIGAVGAKLYYPNYTIQHAGVILGIGGVAGHSHKDYDGNDFGYYNRLKIVQNLSAVTGACLMMRKEVFDQVEGFDESYPYAFNDVDLCMKIRDKGYLIIFTPHAELYHYESKTRGYEDTPQKLKRFYKEIELFKQKWGNILEKGDPYYSSNLTLDREDFSIRI